MRRSYVRDQVVPVLVLLQSAESHLGSRDVLLGVLEVFELEENHKPPRCRVDSATYESALVPFDALGFVCIGVGEALYGTSLATEKPVKVRTDLVSTVLLEGVALCASGLMKYVSTGQSHRHSRRVSLP